MKIFLSCVFLFLSITAFSKSMGTEILGLKEVLSFNFHAQDLDFSNDLCLESNNPLLQNESRELTWSQCVESLCTNEEKNSQKKFFASFPLLGNAQITTSIFETFETLELDPLLEEERRLYKGICQEMKRISRNARNLDIEYLKYEALTNIYDLIPYKHGDISDFDTYISLRSLHSAERDRFVEELYRHATIIVPLKRKMNSRDLAEDIFRRVNASHDKLKSYITEKYLFFIKPFTQEEIQKYLDKEKEYAGEVSQERNFVNNIYVLLDFAQNPILARTREVWIKNFPNEQTCEQFEQEILENQEKEKDIYRPYFLNWYSTDKKYTQGSLESLKNLIPNAWDKMKTLIPESVREKMAARILSVHLLPPSMIEDTVRTLRDIKLPDLRNKLRLLKENKIPNPDVTMVPTLNAPLSSVGQTMPDLSNARMQFSREDHVVLPSYWIERGDHSIMAHEMGHIVMRELNENYDKTEYVDLYKKIEETAVCLNELHGIIGDNVEAIPYGNTNLSFLKAKTEEDIANFFAIEYLKRTNTSSEFFCTNFMSMNPSQIEYSELSGDNDKYKDYSSPLFRQMMHFLALGREIPSVCKEKIEASYPSKSLLEKMKTCYDIFSKESIKV